MYLSGSQIVEMIGREDVRALLQRVHDGHDTEWNGNNWVGKLSDDAEKACDALSDIFESEDGDVQVWNVGDWLFSNCTLADHWPAGEMTLDDAVKGVEDTIEPNMILNGDIEDALLEDAQHKCRTLRSGLGENHLAALLKHEYADEEEIAEYRESESEK